MRKGIIITASIVLVIAVVSISFLRLRIQVVGSLPPDDLHQVLIDGERRSFDFGFCRS